MTIDSEMTSENQIVVANSIERQVDQTLGLVKVFTRLEKDVYDQYVELADQLEVPLIALIRQILTNHLLVKQGNKMGTNYYLIINDDNDKKLHIGKSSGGWVFSLRIYPDVGINDLDDWIPMFSKGTIVDEYNDVISYQQLMMLITERRSNKQWDERTYDYPYSDEQSFHKYNYSERGPNNLFRSVLDSHCVKHGAGTWSCFANEFC